MSLDVCEHGNLKRQCALCELTQERDEARAQVAAMRRALEEIDALDPSGEPSYERINGILRWRNRFDRYIERVRELSCAALATTAGAAIDAAKEGK